MYPYVEDYFITPISTAYEWISAAVRNVFVAIWEFVTIVTLSVYYVCEAIVFLFVPAFMRTRQNLRGKTVLITGGAGGVGRELTIRLVRRRARVIIWDNNENALETLKEDLDGQGYHIHTYAVDVSDRDAVYKYANVIRTECGPIDVLINNAGIVCGQTFLDLPDYMIEKTFKVNVLSQFWTMKAFLPDMLKIGRGHIVTMGSLTGMLGTYKCTDYSASKHAVIGFHESLRTELKTHGHFKINTTLICPYFINTGMFAGCKPRHWPMLEPETVAKRIITAIQYREEFVTLPAFSRYVLPLKYYLPEKLNWTLLVRVIQGPQSMMGLRNFQEVEAA